jgi:hypothetical protein
MCKKNKAVGGELMRWFLLGLLIGYLLGALIMAVVVAGGKN